MQLPDYTIGMFPGITFRVVLTYERNRTEVEGQLVGNIYAVVVPQSFIDTFQVHFSIRAGKWISDINVAKIIAGELGITKVISNVLPSKKASTIKDLVSKGKKVIMVGDGINDAPALVNSTIGISVNDGTADSGFSVSDVRP